MGKVFSSMVKRPLKNFNIANRAEREVSAPKPKAAPRHPTKENIQVEVPGLHEKQEQLLSRLQQVKVVSTVISEGKESNRPLPQSREATIDFEYGIYEPTKVPPGKATLRHIVQLLTAYHQQPKVNTPEVLAEEYKLDLKDVKNVILYFRPLEVFIPGQQKPGTLISSYSQISKIKEFVEAPFQKKDHLARKPVKKEDLEKD